MKERTEPCKQCGAFDFYYKGNFSYCRPCHNEASKRYQKSLTAKESQKLPKRDLEYLMSTNGKKGASERSKLSCPQGHPYSGENLKINRQRSGKSLFRKCRTCDRNRKRVLYGLDPEPGYIKLTDLLDKDLASE